MIKNILITLLLITVVGFGIVKLLQNSFRMEWGHYFSFENELNIEIDSLEITVGDRKTIIRAGSDSLRTLGRNVDVPKKGYPHEVTLKIYSQEESMTLKADSFNCYNCDGSHEYTLTDSGAVYKFYN